MLIIWKLLNNNFLFFCPLLLLTMRILTTTEYNEVCKSYEQFGSKLFDEMFLGYDDNSVSYLYNEDYYFGGAK